MYHHVDVLQSEEKYGGLGVSELRQSEQLKIKNSKLKKIVADLSLLVSNWGVM